jgi:hypothetical protein
MSNNLIPPKAPNLLIAPPTEYEARYQEQLNAALRLYFNTVDNDFVSLLGPNGGRFLNIPHIAASDSTDQYATATDTPTVVAFNTLDSGSGWTLAAPGSATPNQTGIYKITYSIQVVNTDSAIHDAVFWIRVNSVDVVNSATYFSIPASDSPGNSTYICAYSEATFTITASSVVQLMWATDQAYSTTGPVDGVYLFADPAQTTPYIRPAIPSAIGSITFVSSLST